MMLLIFKQVINHTGWCQTMAWSIVTHTGLMLVATLWEQAVKILPAQLGRVKQPRVALCKQSQSFWWKIKPSQMLSPIPTEQLLLHVDWRSGQLPTSAGCVCWRKKRSRRWNLQCVSLSSSDCNWTGGTFAPQFCPKRAYVTQTGKVPSGVLMFVESAALH